MTARAGPVRSIPAGAPAGPPMGTGAERSATSRQPTRRGRRRRDVLGGALLWAALTVGVAPTASAHTALVSTNPAASSTVRALPAAVVLTFDEPCAKLGTQVVVLGPTGNVATGAPRLVGDDVRQTVTAGSPAGHYTVNWRVTSDDGHPVQGTFSFTSTAGSADAHTTTAAPGSATPPAGPGSATPTAGPLAAGHASADVGTSSSHGAALSAGAAAVLVAVVLVTGAAFTVVARRRRRHR